MARVTVEEVKVILPVGYQLTDPQIQASIDAASCIVDTIALGCASDMSEACLKQVELYLSAHYATVSDQAMSLASETESCGTSSVRYNNGQTGMLSTTFGQMANTLSQGCLDAYDKQEVGIFSLGGCV